MKIFHPLIITLLSSLSFVNVSGQTFNGIGNLLVPPGAPGSTQGVTISTATVSGVGQLGGCNVIDNVTIDFTHTFVGDLALFLISPNGSILELSSGNGGAGNNYQVTTFSDLAGTVITNGNAPFNGSFRPEGRQTNLNCFCSNASPVSTFTFANTFAGENADGVWELYINDYGILDIGTLNSWSITFSNSGTPPNANPTALTACLVNGTATVDLTTANNAVNIGSGATVLWFEDAATQLPIVSPTTYSVTGNTTVYAVVELGGCQSAPVPVTITATTAPVAFPASLTACDNGNGQATFDLTTLFNTINNGTGLPVNFYTNPFPFGPISPSSYTSSGGTVYAIILGLCNSNAAPITLNVVPNPDITLTQSPFICQGQSFDLSTVVTTTTGLPITYHSGAPPTAANQLSSPIVSPNATTVYYAFIDAGGGCTAAMPIQTFVTPASPPNLGSTQLCIGSPPFDLSALVDPAFPTGVWSGPGVSGNFFDPNGQNGTVTLNFAPNDPCGQPGTTTITIIPGITASPYTLDACDNGTGIGTFDLTSIESFVSFGTGNQVNWFSDPAATSPIANPSNYLSGAGQVFATVTSGNCTSTPAQIDLNLVPTPNLTNSFITVNPTSLCGPGTVSVTFSMPESGTAFTVQMDYGNPTNGYQSYVGVNVFDGSTVPFVISETTEFILNTVEVPNNGLCAVTFSNPTTVTVTVNSAPNLSLIDNPTICSGETYNLQNAVFTGSGLPISFHTFNPPNPANELPSPIVSPNANTIYYAFVDGGPNCTAITPIPITIDPGSTPILGTASICVSEPDLDLTTLIDPNFPTGIWIGPGVNGNFFDPSGQIGNVSLTFNPNDPCGLSTATTVTVFSAPAPPLPETIVSCDNGNGQAIFDLTSVEGSISGGVSPVNWYLDPAATIPISNPSAFLSSIGTVYATVGTSACQSVTTAIDLFFLPALNESNTTLSISPLDGCGPTLVDISINVPTSGDYLVNFNYGSQSSTPPFSNSASIGFGPNGTILPFLVNENTLFAVDNVTSTFNGVQCFYDLNPTNETLVTVEAPPLFVIQSPDICTGETTDLVAAVDNPENAILTFHTNTPASSANELPSSQVSPLSNAIFYVLANNGVGCTTEVPVLVTVNPAQSPILNTANVCETETNFNLNILVDPAFPNGTWSGSGVTGNFFSALGQSNTVTLTYTPLQNCAQPNTTTLTIINSLTPQLTSVTLCESALSFSLVSLEDPNFPSGTWSGPGVSGNFFNPSGQSGAVTLNYQPNVACVNNAATTITVIPKPDLISVFTPEICQGESIDLSFTVNTTSGLPITFYSSIPPNSGNQLSSPLVSPVSSTTYYAFVDDGNNCTNTLAIPVDVSNLQTPVLGTSSICSNITSFDLSTLLDPSFPNGTWSGTGVTGNFFQPTGLNGTIALTFDSDEQCVLTTNTSVEVVQEITPILTSATICENVTTFDLNTLIVGSFLTGTWTGAGVNGSTFSPTGLSGIVTLSFLPDGTCVAPENATITIEELGIPQLTTVTVCNNETNFNLGMLLDPNFPNGNWTGLGVTGNSFDATGLSGIVTLIFTPSDPCTAPNTTSIQLTIPISPNLSSLVICEEEAPVNLNSLLDPAFPTGSWSGQGVSGDIFSPTDQSGTYTLTFTSDAICTNPSTTTIVVNESPEIENLATDCTDLNDEYTVSFTITGGDTNSYEVNGQASASNFSSPFIISGQPYNFLVDDVNGCGPVSVSGSFNCDCNTFAGTMNLSGSPFQICADDIFTATTNLDATLDPTDVLVYVLHDESGPNLGNIFATNTIPEFSFPLNGELGRTYYVSSVAANSDSAGSFNPLDACLSVAAGVPVIFYQPSANVGNGGAICASECFTIPFSFTGIAPFEVNYQINTDTGTFEESFTASNNDATLTICPPDLGLIAGQIMIELRSMQDANACEILPNSTSFLIDVFAEPESLIASSFCAGETLMVGSSVFSQNNPTGTVVLENAAANGCDSVVQVDLQFFPIDTTILDPTLCAGTGLTVNGNFYNQLNPAGVETLTSVNGCDSIVFIALSFEGQVTFELTETLCPSDSRLVNAVLYDINNPNGVEVFPNGSIAGCDSVVNVNLSFFPIASSQIVEILCAGDNLLINGTVYDATNPIGSEVLANASANGCDSIVQVSLNFNDDVTTDLTRALCLGESITVNGVVYDETNPTGSETAIGGASNGCDSIVNVTLNFFPVASSQITEILCPGSSLVVNGMLYDESNPMGTEVFPNASMNGCDSTVFVNLSFNEAIAFDLSPSLCIGENLLVNGNLYDESNPMGVEVFLGGSSTGCDSVVNVNLTFLPPAVGQIQETLCTGDNLIVNGTVYDETNPTGTALFPNASINGCDSTVNIALLFNQHVSEDLTISLCAGESIAINGELYDEATPNGQQNFPGASFLGCDSVLNIALVFLPATEFILTDTLPAEESIIVNGTLYNQDNPSGFETIINGAANGCDSTVIINLFFESPTALMVDALTIPPTCFGDSDGQIIVQNIIGGDGEYSLVVNGQAAQPVTNFPFSIPGLAAGSYEISVEDGNGLTATFSLVIADPTEVQLDLGDDIEINMGEDAFLSAQTNIQPTVINWQPTLGLDCVNCLDPMLVSPTESMMYALTITDENGCSGTDEIQLIVRKNRGIYIPNAFSPNGDGINDQVTIYASEEVVNIKQFRIFDRWGNAVFVGINLQPNISQSGWNGRYRGEMMDQGVFVFLAEVEFLDGVIEMIKGDIVLMR